MNNNEQIDRPPIITEDTSEAAAAASTTTGGSAGAAALANASGGDRERFPSPIVSIAAGVMNESTTTTTSTKTTPTPYSNDQMHTMMSHAAETQSKLKQIQQETKLPSTSSSSLSSTCKLDDYTKSHDPPSPFIFVATNNNSTTSSSPASSAAAASSAPAAAVHNFKLSPPLATHTSGGATAKGKTQDDQNVGKRQKKKKTKYDSWEDSEINDLDDASLKKLLEEAYWYRNPGDRKNKSERFLQMLKKAEYDEENSYRAIKTCLTRNTNSSSTAAVAAAAAAAVASSSFVSVAGTSVGSSNSAAGSFGCHTNHRSSGSHRHKQGGSLQDLVEATHRSELATTSSQAAVVAAAAAAAVANHCFNCDYQLSGGRNSVNRRQHQQQQQQHNQNSSSINSQLPNSLSTASSSSASKRINKNSTVSARQREGGSLPSSVNQLESSAIMDPAKLKHILGGGSSGGVGGEVTPTTSTSAGTGSCLSLPETEAATQFDMDDEAIMDSGSTTSTQQDSFMNRWDISADTKLWNIANGPDLEKLEELREIRKTKKLNPASAAGSSFNTHSMTLLGAKILEGLQQQQEQQQKQQQQQQQQQQNQQMHSFNDSSKDASTVKEFLIDDALQFSVLELSAKNQEMQQQQQQQQHPAVPANVSGGAAACVPYPQKTDDQKLRLDTGYVSLNDNYTACSSVYGVGNTDGDSNKTGSSGGASSSITSSTTTTVNGGGGGVGSGTGPKGAVEDIRASKIGRIISGGPAAAAAKSGSRQFDENGNALSDGYGGGAGSGTGNGVAASTNGNSNQFNALITTTVGGGAAGGTATAAANSGSLAGAAAGSAVAAAYPPSSSSIHRPNSVSTLLSSGTTTTTTAMAAAAVAASINSQLGGAVPIQPNNTANMNATNTTITTTKLKSKKKSQQERNTIQYLVDTQTIAGCRGADPVEQLLKYIENDEKNNSAGQKKKERKKQSKLKKSNSLEELRSCSKMEVDDLNKYQAATTEMMRQKKTGSASTGSAPSATGASKHNSSSVADINKNCNKEQQGVQSQQQQTVVASATVQVRAQPRKSERRSWGTEELQYLGDQQQKEQQTQMDWPSAPPAPKMSTLEFPALAGMSEMDALNTVLSETAEFHVVTKKKKPKKQRAVTMDDATVGAAHHTGGNLQRMQPITKSASSNMMSHRVQQQQHYANHYGNQQLPPPPPPHSKMERQFVEKHQSTSTGSSHTSAGSVHAHGQGSQSTSTTSNSSGHQDSSRRKSTSSMPPSEKSDSSDLDSVHSLPIQTGKKKSSRVNSGSSSSSSSTSAQAAGQRQSKQNNNNYNSPPAAISYADIARKRLEAALNSVAGTTSNTESSPPDLFNSGSGVGGGSGKSLSTKQAKTKPDFPELPGAAVNAFNLTTGLPTPAGTAGGGVAAVATHLPPSSTSVTSSASISYSQSLNATPASSTSDVEMASPELLPTASAAAAIGSISFSSASASALSSSSYSSPPALQKSKSVENEVSYTFNSNNLDQQYPALEMTVKRHSTTNVAMASSSINNNTTTNNNNNNNNNNSFSSSASSSSSYNFAAAAKQQVADKSTSAKLKAKPKEKTSSINHSSSKPSQEDASSSVTLSSASSSSPSASTSSSSPTSSSCSPVAATLKTTAATQTDRTKKISGKFGGAAVAGAGSGGTASSGASGGLAGSSSITPSGSSGAAGRPAVIILNDRDDRDATHNEFIFGDFNEDELKMFNDHEHTEESSHSNQENNRNKLIGVGEKQSEVVAGDEDEDEAESKEHSAKLGKESSTDLSSDQLVLNDSGAASDVVNMSSTLDMLSISGEAVQSSPNAAKAAAITNNNSSTLSSNTSNSSSSASISSSASAGGTGGGRTIAGGASGGGGGISSLANQFNDSGIIANTSVNNFISKASSSDVLVSMQQLETCNDIEAAIIAAARAAAAADAAKRSTSCSRSNSQEPGEFILPAKTVNKSFATANKTTLPVYMAYQDGDDDDETLHELSFMPDLNKMELGAATATSLPDEEHLPPPPVALVRQSGVMTNTDLLVDYISSTWNAIVNSKYVTFYSEEPEPES